MPQSIEPKTASGSKGNSWATASMRLTLITWKRGGGERRLSRGRFANLLDALDQSKGDDIIVANRDSVAREGVNDQKRVLAEPCGVGVRDFHDLPASQMQAQRHERISLQFLLYILA